MENKTRHILGVSGGKDSAALAVYLRDRVPNMEYVFCDTGKELKETYEYIDKLEVYLNKHIIRLPEELDDISDTNPFDYYLEKLGNFLPNPQARWCTKDLKLKPFEDFIGTDTVINYVGIRADEMRKGYISTRSNVKTVFPFVEDGITKDGVMNILNESGLKLPTYYEWRSRSGCYFCFYQRKSEWLGLKERHPDLFEQAKNYEKENFTWNEKFSLDIFDDPDFVQSIKDEQNKKIKSKKQVRPNATLIEILDEIQDEEDIMKPCLICHL
ncbi:phosphoadenosine phosphosulfate reductase family protein [Candidatus Neomarinimicrobiota bacterium]